MSKIRESTTKIGIASLIAFDNISESVSINYALNPLERDDLIQIVSVYKTRE